MKVAVYQRESGMEVRIPLSRINASEWLEVVNQLKEGKSIGTIRSVDKVWNITLGSENPLNILKGKVIANNIEVCFSKVSLDLLGEYLNTLRDGGYVSTNHFDLEVYDADDDQNIRPVFLLYVYLIDEDAVRWVVRKLLR